MAQLPVQFDDLITDPEDQLKPLTNSNDRGQKRRKSRTTLENDEQVSKRAVLSLTKPSYNLGLGVGWKSFRDEHRANLRSLASRLILQHRWVEAGDVLRMYIEATSDKKCIDDNRFKFSALLVVLAHLGLDSENNIKSVYDIWIRKNGPMKDQPAEIRFSVHVEFIDWCLRTGNLHDAHQTALWLIQENNFGRDPNSNIVIAMTFYKLWHSTIPKELLRTEKGQFPTPSRSYDRPTYSEGCDRSNSTAHSVQNYKILDTDLDGVSNRDDLIGVDSIQKTENILQNVTPQDFYVNSAENSVSNHADKLPYASFSALQGLKPSLFPIQLPQSSENDGDLFDLHMALLNDYYKEALKYLRLALSSTTKEYKVMRSYVQLLLVGGQVDEALKELDKFCSDSNATAKQMRLRAMLLEHFDCHNKLPSTYFEEILKKDPSCFYSLEKLITIHRDGDYSTTSLLEKIGCHLDATVPNSATWKELALCFLKLSESEEDRMSACQNGNKDGLKQQYSVSITKIPKQFTRGVSREKWWLRCRSWPNRHFRSDKLALEIAEGDMQLLAYKAACAAHMYGRECSYVMDACKCLQEKKETDLYSLLKMNMEKSIQLYSSFKQSNG